MFAFAVSTLEPVMEHQSKKAFVLKAREKANAEPTRDQNAKDSETVRIPEIPPPPLVTEQTVELIRSDEALDST